MNQPSGPLHNQFSNGEDGAFVSAYLDQLGANIRDHGWAVQGVFPTDPEDYSFAYTVGLLDKGCPVELLVSGLAVNTSAHILNEIADEMVQGDKQPPETWELADGYVMRRVLHDFDRDDQLQLGVARAYYRREIIPVAQYVWPSQEHHYPWDDLWPDVIRQPIGGAAPDA